MATDAVEQRRLASSVGAYEPKDAPGFDAETHVFEHGDPAEAQVDLVQGQLGGHCSPLSRKGWRERRLSSELVHALGFGRRTARRQYGSTGRPSAIPAGSHSLTPVVNVPVIRTAFRPSLEAQPVFGSQYRTNRRHEKTPPSGVTDTSSGQIDADPRRCRGHVTLRSASLPRNERYFRGLRGVSSPGGGPAP